MTTYDEIMKEIKQEIEQGQTLEEVKDRSHELVDNYVPVYNNRIVEEWQAMPSDYDNRGGAELGYNYEEINIVKLMMLDLYTYYTDLVDLVITDLEQELESAE
jgi:predicted RNase H-like HicB family nuclease